MPSHKEAHRVFWMVKGWIGPDQLVKDCYDGYCRRLWYDEETYYKEDGFEEAYIKKFK